MLVQKREVAAAVAVGILDLTANLADRLAFPRHFDRGRHPARMPRYAAIRCALVEREVAVGVTGDAWGFPRRHRLMRMLVVALQRTVGRWVTVHAARMRQHLGSLGKNGA